VLGVHSLIGLAKQLIEVSNRNRKILDLKEYLIGHLLLFPVSIPVCISVSKA
jgi:hypothetical protein